MRVGLVWIRELFVVTSSSFFAVARCQEFELLDYSLRSARIFFRADQTAEEEPKEAEPSPTAGGSGGETQQQQQPVEESTGGPPPPPASGAFKS